MDYEYEMNHRSYQDRNLSALDRSGGGGHIHPSVMNLSQRDNSNRYPNMNDRGWQGVNSPMPLDLRNSGNNPRWRGGRGGRGHLKNQRGHNGPLLGGYPQHNFNRNPVGGRGMRGRGGGHGPNRGHINSDSRGWD